MPPMLRVMTRTWTRCWRPLGWRLCQVGINLAAGTGQELREGDNLSLNFQGRTVRHLTRFVIIFLINFLCALFIYLLAWHPPMSVNCVIISTTYWPAGNPRSNQLGCGVGSAVVLAPQEKVVRKG